MAQRKQRKAKKRKDDPLARYVRPTAEREAANDFRSAGAAVRVVPVIDRLHEQGVLTEEEHRALSYYRDQAGLADRSPVRSCLDDTVRGTGDGRGPPMTIVSARIEAGKIEDGMGMLWPLCRAVCVEDWTLERWVLAEWGAMDPERIVDTFPEREWPETLMLAALGYPIADPSNVAMTALDLKYAAGGIIRR